MAHLNRIPIRVKVTLVFLTLVSVIVAAVGLGVYLHTKQSLDDVIRQELRVRAADIAALADSQSTPITPRDRIAQMIGPAGTVVAGRPSTPLLSAPELARARRAAFFADRTEATRLFARPARGGTVIVVGTSLHQREHALESLAAALIVGGAIAVLLAAALAYALTGLALRPIEEMRRLAEHADDPSARLPLPAADDEVRRLGETLNAMLTRIEAALEHERAFVSDASHELRTPLALLRTELDLARTLDSSPEDLRAAIDAAVEDTDRLTDIVTNLLLLARADEGALHVEREPLDADDVLRSVATRYGIDGAAASSHLRLLGDRRLVEQALGNLVANAQRHAASEVRLSARAEGAHVELHVEDDGPGFDESFVDRAFDRFSQSTPGTDGAGLGLAIARALARAQDGGAAVGNRPGGGADAWLSLPRA